jgi:hypothetical protein
MTHEAKRDIVARIATGADAMGVTDIFVTREPFRIAAAALEQIPLRARVHVIDHPLTNTALDSERSLAAYLQAGCRSFVSLGGDGTNRALVRTLLREQASNPDYADVILVPLSTGTNNVYPLLAEPTIAGMVAGLYAGDRLPAPGASVELPGGSGSGEKVGPLARRSKVLHLQLPDGSTDIALIDAVLMRRDHTGNLLPFDPEKIAQLFLSRAEPEAVGMSPIGGYLKVVGEVDDQGMVVHLDPAAGDRAQSINAPLSPGLFGEVQITSWQVTPFDLPVLFRGPGVIACDGDRDHKLTEGAVARVQLRRDGPWVPDLSATMRYATDVGIMAANLKDPL